MDEAVKVKAESAMIGDPVDAKYFFLAWKADDAESPCFTEDEAIIFRAKDNALVPTLKFYQDECARLGASKEFLFNISTLIMYVEKWREGNLKLCKVPD